MYVAMKNNEKSARIAYWLKKDATLTNLQLRELTQASDTLIHRIRKELGIEHNFSNVTFNEMDKAFKKFLGERNKKTDSRSNFNPSYNKREKNGTGTEGN